MTDFVKCYAGSGPVRTWAIAQFGTNVYPIWNIADAAIVCAVPLYLITTVLKRDAPPTADDADDADAHASDPLSSNAP